VEAKGVALITGASSGLGAAIAVALATAGYRVALAARRVDLLEQLAARINAKGGEAACFPTDMRDPEQVAALAGEVIARFGRIDVLINNAGVGKSEATWKLSDETIAFILETNVIAPMHITRAVLPTMFAQGRGHIVNIGSVAGHIGSPGGSVYAASKFALRGWNDALRREVARRGIHVSLVAPGYIRTEMTRDVRGVPMPGPEIIGNAVLKLLRHPRREVVIPWYYNPLIWVSEHFPWAVDLILNWRKKQRD
jgi:short-subunit dehydrogenase